MMALLAMVIPLLFVVGLVLLALGVRGTPVLSAPRCGRCGYDLRGVMFTAEGVVGVCSECGNELGREGGVSFGRWRAVRRWMVMGVVLMLGPAAVLVPVMVIARVRMVQAVTSGPAALAGQTTGTVLAGLSATVDEPWGWQELERRLQGGGMSGAEVDSALAVLERDLNSKRAAGKGREPLHWSGNFVQKAMKSGKASPAQVAATLQAYYGKEPKFTLKGRGREGESVLLTLNEWEPWSLDGMRRVWVLTDVVADGTTKLSVQDRYSHKALTGDVLSGTGQNGQINAALVQSLSPGEHEFAFTFQMGIVPTNTEFKGIDGKPGTAEKWPSPITTWQAVVKRKVTIRPKEQPLVDLVTDDARNPMTTKGATIGVEQAFARPSSRGVEIVVKWKFGGVFSPPVGYRVSIRAGANSIDLGRLFAATEGNKSTTSASGEVTVKALAADVGKLDFIFTPDPRSAEGMMDVDEIWGKGFEIKDVALERFDLQKGP